jgi:pimeloyl-ACP methyl ester carboxylesterase
MLFRKTTGLLRPSWLRKSCLFVAVLSCMASCGVVVTPIAHAIHKDKVKEPVIGQDPVVQDIAVRFGFMALLSEMVYYREEKGGRENRGATCRDASVHRNLLQLPVVDRTQHAAGPAGRWERVLNTRDANFCLDHPNGLFYETFAYRTSNDKVLEVAIVFRGTENPSLRDWSTNLSAATGVEPPQYRVAEGELVKVFKALDAGPYKGASVYTAGHSLGGGLAQMAAYRFKRVGAAYAFNSSPVTNWSWMVFKGDIKEDWPVIYRVYHSGEVLGIVRNAAAYTTSTRFNRYDIGLQLQEKSLVTGHAMKIMACGLAKIIARSARVDGAHHYPVRDAERIYATEGMCSDFRKDNNIGG